VTGKKHEGFRGAKSKPAALDAILRTPDVGLSSEWTPAGACPDRIGAGVTFLAAVTPQSLRAYLLRMNFYPEMFMKNKVLSDEARGFSTTWVQNQPVETQAFSRIEVRLSSQKQKDVKNEGRSGYIYENKGSR
jgi:hypothetical protein